MGVYPHFRVYSFKCIISTILKKAMTELMFWYNMSEQILYSSMWPFRHARVSIDPRTLAAEMSNMLQSLWRGLFSNLGLLHSTDRVYQFDTELLQAVRDLAIREQRSEDEVTADLLSLALLQKDANEIRLRYWNSLSYREQQVVALTCLNYTNRQIAARLQISPMTVATHIRNVLYKLDLHSKSELRHTLSAWDFKDWVDAC